MTVVQIPSRSIRARISSSALGVPDSIVCSMNQYHISGKLFETYDVKESSPKRRRA